MLCHANISRIPGSLFRGALSSGHPLETMAPYTNRVRSVHAAGVDLTALSYVMYVARSWDL